MGLQRVGHDWVNNNNPASLDSKGTHATKLHLKQKWHMQLSLSGIVLKWATCVSFSLSLLPSNWNVDVMPGAPAAILDHKMTMWLEAIMEKQLTRWSQVPDTKKTALAIPPYFLTMKEKYNFTLLNYCSAYFPPLILQSNLILWYFHGCLWAFLFLVVSHSVFSSWLHQCEPLMTYI